MNNEKIRNKCTYFVALGCMCVVLVSLTYMFFLRTIKVDITKDIKMYYDGENGVASAEAKNKSTEINQRVRELLDSVTYEISPNTDLSNGDVIHIVASYDKSLASEYHFSAINKEIDIVVDGLKNRYESLEDIDLEYLDKIDQAVSDYIDDHSKKIFELENGDKEGKMIEKECIYKAFLDSNSSQISDRVVQVYALQYIYLGEEKTIYYTVTVPNINDGNKVKRSDVFGEKAYLTDKELETVDIKGYMKRIYGSQFEIEEFIEPTDEIIEEESTEEKEETE